MRCPQVLVPIDVGYASWLTPTEPHLSRPDKHSLPLLAAVLLTGLGWTVQRWLQKRLETLQDTDALSHEEERYALRLLADAENFENLLGTLFPGTKRFSLEGGESLIPLLDQLVEVGPRTASPR